MRKYLIILIAFYGCSHEVSDPQTIMLPDMQGKPFRITNNSASKAIIQSVDGDIILTLPPNKAANVNSTDLIIDKNKCTCKMGVQKFKP